MRVLERHVQIGQHPPVAIDRRRIHQFNHIVHMRIRIHIMHTHPHAQLRQFLGQRLHVGFHRTTVDKTRAVFDVHAIRAGVLRHHEQLLHARVDQLFRLAHHLANRTADQITAQRRDDAECTTVVTTLRDFQIRIMLRRKFHPLRWHQIGERIVRFRQMQMHRVQHLIACVRAGHRQYFRMQGLHQIAAVRIRTRTETAGHHYLTVFVQRFANRVERLLHRAVDKTAGVDHHQIRPLIRRRNFVALNFELGQNILGVHQRLRTTQRHKTHFRRTARIVCLIHIQHLSHSICAPAR